MRVCRALELFSTLLHRHAHVSASACQRVSVSGQQHVSTACKHKTSTSAPAGYPRGLHHVPIGRSTHTLSPIIPTVLARAARAVKGFPE
eukprot:2004079-Rhodomonas_salina.1